MKVFRIPVKIEVPFFAIAVFLGLSRSRDITLIVEWVAVVFVSVLLHEFGHALAARAFGLEPEIRLYQMGGLTSWRSEKEVAPLKHLAISLAGPFTGFALGTCVFLLGPLFLRAIPVDLAATTYFDLLWVNIGWGIFNLLPMLPLDGGQVLVTLEAWILKRKDRIISHAVSLLVAAAIALAAFYFRQLWIVFLAIFFAYLNGSFLFRRFQIHRDRKLRDSLDQARSLIERDEFDAALELSAKIRASAKSDEVKQTAARLAVIGYLKQAKLEQAEEELRRYTIFFGGDSYLQGALHFLKGEMTTALPYLEATFESYPENEIGKMFYKILVATRDFAGALDLCRHPAMSEVSWELSIDLQGEAFNHGVFRVSTAAGTHAFEQKADARVAYNVACSFSRDAMLKEALEWLHRSVDHGFDDKDALLSDPDLEAVRSLPEFRALVERFESRYS